MAAHTTREIGVVSIKRERIRTTLIPYGISNDLVTPMDEGQVNNPIDAAAEITDAMMSSLADVVKNVIANPEEEDSPVSEMDEVEESEPIQDESQIVEIDTTVDDLVAEGEAAHRSGEHDSALKAFNKAIALDPSNSMAWFNRGVLLEAEQDAKGARQAFVICLDLDPDHGPALANLAVLLDRLGETDGAVEITHRALQYFPGHPNLVKILESNKAAGGIMHSTPTVMPHKQESLVEQTLTHAVNTGVDDLFEENETMEVLEISNVSENLVEEETEGEELAAEVLFEDEQESIDLDALCAQATNSLSQGDAKGALQMLKEHLHAAAAQHFDSWRISAGAMAAMALDDHAISAYTHAIGLEPTNAKCYFNLGALHERKGNSEAAKKCFISALEHDSSYMKAATRLATISEATGDIASLLSARRSLIGDEGGREALALLLIELAEGESRVLENTSGLPPTIPEGPALANEAASLCEPNSQMMGRALSASGNHTESVKCWKSMIQDDKSNPDLWIGLARALESAGDMATAQRCHEKAHGLANPQPVVNDPLDAFAESQESMSQPEPAAEISSYQSIETTPEIPSIELTPPIVSDPIQKNNVPLPELSARAEPVAMVSEPKPEVDLAAAALDAASRATVNTGMDSKSNSIANQDIEWYNKGVGLIEDKKYREALSCFDRALPSFADDDEMVIRILNGRGNALYYLEDYPKCVESYHQAMVINPKGVQGKTLYNMGTAYAEMQRFGDAIKCFEQAMPRGLDKDQQKLAKEQIRRCNILQKEQQRKMS